MGWPQVRWLNLYFDLFRFQTIRCKIYGKWLIGLEWSEWLRTTAPKSHFTYGNPRSDPLLVHDSHVLRGLISGDNVVIDSKTRYSAR